MIKQIQSVIGAIIICATTTISPPTINAQGNVLRGSVRGGDLTTGVYTIPTTEQGTLKLVGATQQAANGGGFLLNNNYYVCVLDHSSAWNTNKVYPYNAEDWTPATTVHLNGGYPYHRFYVSDYAVEESTGKVYGCALNNDKDGYNLYTYTFDFVSTAQNIEIVGGMTTQLGAMAFDKDGQLYGIDGDGVLYKVDKATGSLTRVGDTGISSKAEGSFYPVFHSSAIIDPLTDKMYWSVTTPAGQCSLYEVSTATGAATKLRDFDSGVEVNGLYMGEAEADPGAPAAATDLVAHFEGTSLSGKLEFNAPRTTYGGDNLEEDLRFRILANGEQVAEGRVYAKAWRLVDFSVPERGDYEIKVICSNAKGDGPAAKLKTAIGFAAPMAPVVRTTATNSAYSSSVNIEWDPVTTTIDGADLGEIPVTYRVVRYPDGLVIEESTSSTSCWDFNTESGQHVYEYGVTAYAMNTPSEEGRSKVVTGFASTPYQESFEDKGVTDLYTIIDANADEHTWSFYAGDMAAPANSDYPADDWLITPAINVGSQKYYQFSIDMRVRSSEAPGKFEVKFGNAPTIEAMQTVVLEPTTVSSENYTTYKGTIYTGDTYGAGYVGIHCLTGADGWWMYATNLRVSAAYDGSVPEAPSDMTVSADPKGEMKTEIILKAPQKTLDGTPISSLSNIEIYRDGQLIHTEENPNPNAEIRVPDTEVSETGEHTYTAKATNWSGTGLEAEARVYVGVNLPAPPPSVIAYETSTYGEVTVEWEPVTTFVNGQPMDPSLATYSIYTTTTSGNVKLFENITGTSYTFTGTTPEEPQMFYEFGVTASTPAGENLQAAITEKVPVGAPYDAPFEDSFPDLTTGYGWVRGGSDTLTYWDLASDNTFEEVQSVDGDNGLIAMYGSNEGSMGHLYSGKINIENLEKPMLTFYLYNFMEPRADENTVDIYLRGAGARDYDKVKSIVLKDLLTEGWHRIEIPLETYKEKKSVQVMFIGTTINYNHIHLDNIQVRDRYACDVALTEIDMPVRVKAGNTAVFEAGYANFGLDDVETAVELWADGAKIADKQLGLLKSDSRGTAMFEVPYSVTTPEHTVYQLKISASGDLYPSNNSSDEATVTTVYPNYPAVEDLRATFTADDSRSITLTWGEPDRDAPYDDDVTEGFEGASTWTNEGLDGWTFIDRDGYGIYGFNFFEIPEYAPQAMSQQSWFTLDDSYIPLAEHFSDPRFYKAHSGHKYLCSMAVTDADYKDKRSDDWAISPRLNGRAQTISFWASSMLADALETIEVLYTFGSADDTDSYVSVATYSNVPWEWKQYFFDVPEGATHFALRSVSRDAYVLMVDDVNFTPAEHSGTLEIGGYNIYRDGIRLNDDIVNECRFVDTLQDDGRHVYNVTVMYTGRGESMFSNDAVPELSSISTLDADGEVTVEGTYTLSGIRVEGIPTPGIYVQRMSDGTARKIQVK